MSATYRRERDFWALGLGDIYSRRVRIPRVLSSVSQECHLDAGGHRLPCRGLLLPLAGVRFKVYDEPEGWTRRVRTVGVFVKERRWTGERGQWPGTTWASSDLAGGYTYARLHTRFWTFDAGKVPTTTPPFKDERGMPFPTRRLTSRPSPSLHHLLV